MGGDGGTVAIGRKYIRGSSKNKDASVILDKESDAERRLEIYTSCSLSRKPLSSPIVYCRLGYLYNKEDLLVALIERTVRKDDRFKHVRKMADVKLCELTLNPAFKQGKSDPTKVSRFICPVTQMEMNGKHPFVVLETSRRVLSLKAVKEMNIEEPLIELFPSREKAENLRQQLKARMRVEKRKESKLKREYHKKPKKDHIALNGALAEMAKKVTIEASTVVSKSKTASNTFTKLFEKDKTDETHDKNRLFMMGNPRGYVRT